MFPYAGEIFSVLCAAGWSVGVILFRMSGYSISATSLNLFKNVLASTLLLITMLIFGISFCCTGIEPIEYAILIFSGIIGIALADTLFFVSLNILGASLSAIVDCLYSPLTILFAYILIGERMLFWDYVGGAIIISAVFIISARSESIGIKSRDLIKGILIGALSMALMAVGIVMAKPILDKTPVLWSATLRLLGATVMLSLYTLVRPDRKKIWRVFIPGAHWKVAFPASFIGAYLAMMLWIAGMKYTQASIAAILNQMSTIFIVVLAVIFLKEKLTLKKTVAVVLAVAGAVMVVLG